MRKGITGAADVSRSFCANNPAKKKNTYLYRVRGLEDYVNKFFDEPLNGADKKVMLIRHAVSEGNEKHIIYGLSDYALTPRGVAQASSLSPVMKHRMHQFTDIKSSALRRTYETGGYVLGIGGNPTEQQIKRDARFNEFDFGPLEDLYSGKMDSFEHELFFLM